VETGGRLSLESLLIKSLFNLNILLNVSALPLDPRKDLLGKKFMI